MNREQAKIYLRSSGFSEEQIDTIEQAFRQEPCKNAISRQAAIDAINRLSIHNFAYEVKTGWIVRGDAVYELRQLPSVTCSGKPNRSGETQECEDAISRQDAISIIQNWLNFDTGYSWGEKNVMKCAISELRDLPSVSTEKQNRCNQCKYYEGVHNVQGHAPCSFLKCGGVLWDWHCSNYEPIVAESEVQE